MAKFVTELSLADMQAIREALAPLPHITKLRLRDYLLEAFPVNQDDDPLIETVEEALHAAQ